MTVDIGRGEYVTVSGPSGCGKSTFLAILALLDSPTSGRYWLNGRATGELSPSERARTRNVDVGLIFQSFNLIGDMSIYENVEYPLTVRGASASDRRQRVEAALERVGLTARAKQRPGALSGGHQQLVAIARAFAGRPPILLADEPTGNLDSKSGAAVMKMLDELHADGATVCLRRTTPTTSPAPSGTSTCSTAGSSTRRWVADPPSGLSNSRPATSFQDFRAPTSDLTSVRLPTSDLRPPLDL